MSAPIILQSPTEATVRVDPAEWLAPLPLSAFPGLRRDLALEYRLLRHLSEDEDMLARLFDHKSTSLDRYRDIQPFKNNRVLLGETCGYINASHMVHMNDACRFIASQGPLWHTIGDHWQMVWEQEVDAIFAIGKLTEGAVEKCALYWPIELGKPAQFASLDKRVFEICLESVVIDELTEMRRLKLVHNGQVKHVYHCHFVGWPDHQTIETKKLINFVKLVLKQGSCKLVHCSAGVGRTGCVLTLARLMAQIAADRSVPVSVLETALQLRQDRMYMMQTTGQYLSVYAALAELAVGE